MRVRQQGGPVTTQSARESLMRPTSDIPHYERTQYLVLGLLSLGVIGFTAIASLFPGTPFQRYFRGIHPVLAVASVIVLGIASLVFLRSRGWFAILAMDRSRRGIAVAATIATVFAVTIVPIDLVTRFPRNLNVPPPQSLFFYPAIGYVVEVAFHAVPLALLLGLVGPLWKKRNTAALVWPCLLFASVLEPLLQVRLGSTGTPFAWAEGYVALHVFAFNLLQLHVFRRFDFVSMYAFRLVYYVYWHIIWGYLRLRWLY